MKNNHLFDLHTHRHDAPANAFINLPMEVLSGKLAFTPLPGRSYSAGIHPLFEGDWEKALIQLVGISIHPQIKAIGECGLDNRSKTPLPTQIEFLQRQAELAQEQSKPLIIHCVHCWNELIATCKPSKVHYIVHGFRGKPQLAQQLLRAGFSLSFGPLFNPESLKLCPPQKYYLETDDNPGRSIQQVANLHAIARESE